MSGISNFEVDGAGNILWVDSHKMKDTDGDAANGITLAAFNKDTMNSATVTVVTDLF